MNYQKFKIRSALKPRGRCKLCDQPMKWGDRYYDGGKNKVHVKCNDGKETHADKDGYAKKSDE